MSTADEEELARQRVRRHERGESTAEENRALEWLATRLRRDDVALPGRMSDWHTAASWPSTHWLKLKNALESIDPRDHSAIDRAFEEYQRTNRLLIDITPRETKSTGENRIARRTAPANGPMVI